MFLKKLAKNFFVFLHLDITRNMVYDRMTKAILKTLLPPTSRCLDIGCHKGEILDMMLKYAPLGEHFGFEPIPYLYENLNSKYNGKAHIYPYALSDEDGKQKFYHVKNAPAYSGLKQRLYDIKHPDIEEITVQIRKLDSVLPLDTKIDFIKIDVEGGELGVLKGAAQIIKQNKPIILFETGLGASEFYGTQPEDLFIFIKELNLNIFTVKNFIKQKACLSLSDFMHLYNHRKEYYFIAAPEND